MIVTKQHTGARPGIKTVAAFLLIGAAAILTGVALGWGFSRIFSGLKPVSFYVLSNTASAIESLSLLFTSEEKLSVESSGQVVNSGNLFTLTFNHVNKKNGEGGYSLNYPCLYGLKLSRVSADSKGELPCGEKAFLGSAVMKSVTLKAALVGVGTLDVPLTFYYFKEKDFGAKPLYVQALITVVGDGTNVAPAAKRDTASATQAVAPSKVSAAPSIPQLPASLSTSRKNTHSSATIATTGTTPKTGTKTEKTFVYYSTGSTASDPNGAIDLEPRILEIGFVDKDTNIFTASSSPSANLRIAVRFEVINKGTKASDSWSFNVVLPTMPLYIYSGDSQQSLAPGEKIEFVIGFDSVERKKDAEFIVNVDPTSRVVESDESNNIVKTFIQPVF